MPEKTAGARQRGRRPEGLDSEGLVSVASGSGARACDRPAPLPLHLSVPAGEATPLAHGTGSGRSAPALPVSVASSPWHGTPTLRSPQPAAGAGDL